jgi:hypothetical protein
MPAAPATATDGLRDKWYYQVTFTPPEPDRPFGLQPSFTVYVLSDSTVVAPTDSGIDDIEQGAAPNAAPPHR